MQFKEYRESKRIGQVTAAKQLNVTYTSIWRWETGRAVPTRIQQLLIQDWSNGAVTPEDWFEGFDEENTEQVIARAVKKTMQAQFGKSTKVAAILPDANSESLTVWIEGSVDELTDEGGSDETH